VWQTRLPELAARIKALETAFETGSEAKAEGK
jgi:hypothetical protein